MLKLRPLLRPSAWLPALATSLLLAGCAKIADPQPPNLTPPSTVSDLRLEQMENHIILDFSLPSTFVDGSPLELNYAAVYRLVLVRGEDPGAVTPDRMAREGQLIQELWTDDLQKLAQGSRFRFEDVVAFPDPNWIFQRSFVYGLRFYSPRRVASAFTNLAFVAPLAPAAAPRSVTGEAGEGFVRLRWNAPAGNIDGSVPPRVTGYLVFRGDRAENTPLLERLEGDVREYTDRSIQSDQTYYYRVQTQSSMDPASYGPRSSPVAVDTRDQFAPALPQGLAASILGSSVSLVWEPNSESDLRGYNVYRETRERGAFQKIGTVVVNSFTDPSPGSGAVSYRVTAIDRRGNEGLPSEIISVDLP